MSAPCQNMSSRNPHDSGYSNPDDVSSTYTSLGQKRFNSTSNNKEDLSSCKNPPKRRKRRFKEAGQPKHPCSAFLFFLTDERAKVAAENPGATVGQVSKLLGEKWRSLSKIERKPWELKARDDKERYALQMEEWAARKSQEAMPSSSTDTAASSPHPKSVGEEKLLQCSSNRSPQLCDLEKAPYVTIPLSPTSRCFESYTSKKISRNPILKAASLDSGTVSALKLLNTNTAMSKPPALTASQSTGQLKTLLGRFPLEEIPLHPLSSISSTSHGPTTTSTISATSTVGILNAPVSPASPASTVLPLRSTNAVFSISSNSASLPLTSANLVNTSIHSSPSILPNSQYYQRSQDQSSVSVTNNLLFRPGPTSSVVPSVMRAPVAYSPTASRHPVPIIFSANSRPVLVPNESSTTELKWNLDMNQMEFALTHSQQYSHPH